MENNSRFNPKKILDFLIKKIYIYILYTYFLLKEV